MSRPGGDEPGFLALIWAFGHHLDLEALRTYRAMTTPLAFLVYAAWGHLAGFETWQLRLLSPILAIATCAVLNAGLRSYGVGRAARTIAVATLCVNPYFVGVGVFVYTDMLALLMLAVLIVAVGRERAWLAALGAGAGVLTRQYELFAVSGFIAAASRTWQRGSLVVAVALLPAAALCWLWHGLAPVSDMRTVYLAEPIRFHLPWLSLYLAAPGIYAAPVVVWALIDRRPGMWPTAMAAAIACVTVAFPVQPAPFQVANCCPDAGYVHRALLATGRPWLVLTVFFVASAAWLAPALDRLQADVTRWCTAPPRAADLFPWLALASFLVLMPLSYMPWEKYALPELFVVFLVLARPRASIS